MLLASRLVQPPSASPGARKAPAKGAVPYAAVGEGPFVPRDDCRS